MVTKIMHGLLNFPCDAAAPCTLSFVVVLLRLTNSIGIKPVTANMRLAFDYSLVLERIEGLDCLHFFHGDIQFATECTMAAPHPRRPPLTLPPISPPKPSWLSLVFFTARCTNKRGLT